MNDLELPIDAEDQFVIGKYNFVVYPQADKTYAVKVHEPGQDSFWLAGRFETWGGYLHRILYWLETQTWIGEKIDVSKD